MEHSDFSMISDPEFEEHSEEDTKGLLLDLLVEELGSPGLVVDADLAARTSCSCVKVDNKDLCHSAGIIGTLSQPQVEAHCPTRTYLPDGRVKRVERFREAASKCKAEIADIPKGEQLEPWLICMVKQNLYVAKSP